MPTRPYYFSDDGDLSHYRALATEIEEPDVNSDRIGDVEYAEEPLTLRNMEAREIWDLTLQEAVQTAVANSKVLRATGGSSIFSGTRAGSVSRVSQTPTSISTTYTPAITESDPRFGVEGALAAFDAQLSSSMFWERNDRPQNFFITGFQAPVFQQDLGTQTTELNKRSATGGQYFVRNHNNYELNNNPQNLFRGAYTADIEAEFRHPLLQGAGVQFNRIAGPSSVPGFYNGVVIARLQQDEALADLEAAVRNTLSDTEQAYWRLSFTYRDLDTKRKAMHAALEALRRMSPDVPPYVVARAREQYFFFRNQVEDALSEMYTADNNLRYMMGIAATDGRLLRPSDEPTSARVTFDWFASHQEMLVRQAELRGQKFRIKEAEMRLTAAKNFLMPRLDVVGRYRWRGLGEKLLDGQRENTQNQLAVNAANPDPTSRFNSAYQTLTQGDYQEWQLGAQFSMPIGFRREMAGVRNEELKLARERAVLQEMELEISHQLSEAIRALDREYTATQTNYNRYLAVRTEVEMLETIRNAGADPKDGRIYDVLFQAERRLADAESSFYAAMARYNVAIAGVHYRKGSLLEYNGVHLSEGPWADKAYFDAYTRARERDAGIMIDYGFNRPNLVTRGAFQPGADERFAPTGDAVRGETNFTPAPLEVPSEGPSFDLPGVPGIESRPVPQPDQLRKVPQAEPVPAPRPDTAPGAVRMSRFAPDDRLNFPNLRETAMQDGIEPPQADRVRMRPVDDLPHSSTPRRPLNAGHEQVSSPSAVGNYRDVAVRAGLQRAATGDGMPNQ